MASEIDLTGLKNQIPDTVPNTPAARELHNVIRNAVSAIVALAMTASAATIQATPASNPVSTEVHNPDNFVVGQTVKNEGVFIGWYNPNSDEVADVRDTTHDVALFVAPTDVKKEDGKTNLLLTFNKMVTHIATMTGFFGYDGEKLSAETYKSSLKQRLQNLVDTEGTGWLIGTGPMVRQQRRNKNMFDLRGSYETIMGSDNAHCYWSCTEPHDGSSYVWPTSFSDGDVYWYPKDYFELSTRPVRARRFAMAA